MYLRRRYSRTDEIGIPFALTVENSTLDTGMVTLRDRDSCGQVALPVADAGFVIVDLCSGRLAWTDVLAKYVVRSCGQCWRACGVSERCLC